jgi:flagellar biosynthesis/type III secretory pathway M-ring protein FliF/YscJ
MEGMDVLLPALSALAPTVLIGLVFWFIMRALLRADKSERRAKAKIEAEERAKMGLPAKASAE